jgi:glycerate kinase
VLRETGVADALRSARALVTGEGSYDEQSYMGKITGALVQLAAAHNVPVLVLSGARASGDPYAQVVTGGGAQLTEAHLESLVRQHLGGLLHA